MEFTDKLKPCPFCGSDDSRTGNGTVRPHKNRARNLGPDRYHYAISCGTCGFNGPRGLDEQQAIDGWQRRTLPADTVMVSVENLRSIEFCFVGVSSGTINYCPVCGGRDPVNDGIRRGKHTEKCWLRDALDAARKGEF